MSVYASRPMFSKMNSLKNLCLWKTYTKFGPWLSKHYSMSPHGQLIVSLILWQTSERPSRYSNSSSRHLKIWMKKLAPKKLSHKTTYFRGFYKQFAAGKREIERFQVILTIMIRLHQSSSASRTPHHFSSAIKSKSLSLIRFLITSKMPSKYLIPSKLVGIC